MKNSWKLSEFPLDKCGNHWLGLKSEDSYLICLATLWNSNTFYQINHSPLFEACSSPGHGRTNTSVCQEWESPGSQFPLDQHISGWCVRLDHPLFPSSTPSPSVQRREVFNKWGRASFQSRVNNSQATPSCIL